MARYDSFDSLTKALKQDGYENALNDFKTLANTTQKLVYNQWATNRNTAEIDTLLTDTNYDAQEQTAVRDFLLTNGMLTQYSQLRNLDPACQTAVWNCWQQGNPTFGYGPDCDPAMGGVNSQTYDPELLTSLITQARTNNCKPCNTPACDPDNTPIEALLFVGIAVVALWIVGSNTKDIV